MYSLITPSLLTMKRAHSVNSILSKKFNTLNWSKPWRDAFDRPEDTGAWFIWGSSANGKTSFVLQLCKELSNTDRVAFLSLEEGTSKTLQDAIRRAGFSKKERRNFIIVNENIAALKKRLTRQRPPRVIVIDSFQYTDLSFPEYLRLIEENPDKLFIFTSHADGKQPSGRTAKRVMFDASLKIWVEGFRAISKGRYIGTQGFYDIWPEGSQMHWSNNSDNTTINITRHEN